jgi:hypothetical protein
MEFSTKVMEKMSDLLAEELHGYSAELAAECLRISGSHGQKETRISPFQALASQLRFRKQTHSFLPYFSFLFTRSLRIRLISNVIVFFSVTFIN